MTLNMNFHVYSLRSSYVCNLLAASVDFLAIRAAMRHFSLQSTAIYASKSFKTIRQGNFFKQINAKPLKLFDVEYEKSLHEDFNIDVVNEKVAGYGVYGNVDILQPILNEQMSDDEIDKFSNKN